MLIRRRGTAKGNLRLEIEDSSGVWGEVLLLR